MKTKRYTHLSSKERAKIAVLRTIGLRPSKIAKILERNKSTVIRKIKGNSTPVYDVYSPYKAQERAERRKKEAAKRPRLKNNKIKQYVIDKFKKGWLPEQISGRLPIDHPGLAISHETIYQYIYTEQQALIPCLACSHRKRKKRGQGKKHSSSHIPNRVSIEERPGHIEKRQQVGHLKANTMISRQSKVALVVAAERMSRLVKIGKLEQKSAAELRKALIPNCNLTGNMVYCLLK